MQLSRRVVFNGVRLGDVSPYVVVKSVDRGAPKKNTQAADRLGGFGQRITQEHWQTLDATVTFAIDVPKEKGGLRAHVFSMVRNWACGSLGYGRPADPWLKIDFAGRGSEIVGVIVPSINGNTNINLNPFAGQRLYVDEVIFPGAGDLYDWTKEYTITFRAVSVPFWQDSMETSGESVIGTEIPVTLNVPGNIRTPVNAIIRNRSGMNIDNLLVWTELSQISFSNLGFGRNEYLYITHGDTGLLSIMKGSSSLASVYSKYSGSDDLLILPGVKTVWFRADRGCSMSVSVCGRYL